MIQTPDSFIPETVSILRRHGENTITAEVETQLCRISSATIDRLLRPYRTLGGCHPFTTNKPASLLKSPIPITNFAERQEERPCFLEVDLLSHCGDSTESFNLITLCTARTPCQRLLEAGVLTEVKRQELAVVYHFLNPILLLKRINENLEGLWNMKERLAHQ